MLYFQGIVSSVAFLLGLCLFAVTVAHGCEEVHVRTKEGVLVSPHRPQQNVCIRWIFDKREGDVVTLSFVSVDLPRDPQTGACISSYIEIGDATSPRVVCGEEAQPYTSPGYESRFTMTFFTGSISQAHGFKVSYVVGPLNSVSCASFHYHCNSGKCIPNSWRCNGQKECQDGSDEFFCHGAQPAVETRPSSTTHRPTTPLLSPFLELSSRNDCNQVFHNVTARFGLRVHQGTLSNEMCIFWIKVPGNVNRIVLRFLQLDLKSDAYIAVYEGSEASPANLLGKFVQDSDIYPVTSHSSSMLVEFFMFQEYPATASGDLFFSAQYHAYDSCELDDKMSCGPKDDNQCYTGSKRCDGVWDCPNSGSDEAGCYTCEQDNQMSCGPEDGYQCYSRFKHCDGVWDCPNSGFDEAGCHGCPNNKYSCNDFAHSSTKNCYFKHDRCNGGSVCANDADEMNCNKQQCSESRNLFLCANKRCISYNFVCDEMNDCGDHSDEDNCKLGPSRKVIVAAVVGALLCALLLILSLGCACRVYTMRNNNDAGTHHHHHHRRGTRYDTPLSRLQAELFRRRAPPPPYHEAMLTSRPYDDAVREYFAQTQPTQQSEQAEQERRSAEEGDSVEESADSGDSSGQNLISLMDLSEEGGVPRQAPGENSRHLESGTFRDTSSDSDSEADGAGHGDNGAVPAEDDSGQIEMMENFSRGRSVSSNQRTDENESIMPENLSEDSASAVLSADSHDTLSLADETQEDSGSKVEQDSHSTDGRADDSDKNVESDADSVCILCLDDDPAALDDGSDTRCLLQDV